jgi:hypothetical protein
MEPAALALIEPDHWIAQVVDATVPVGLQRRPVTIEAWTAGRELGLHWCGLLNAALFRVPSAHRQLAELGTLLRPAEIVLVDPSLNRSPVPVFGAYVPAIDAQDRLWPALRGTAARTLVRQARRAAHSLAGLADPDVVRALDALLTAPTPFSRVISLAAFLNVGDGVLRRKWRRDIVGRGGPALLMTIDAVLLLRLLETDPTTHRARDIQREWHIGADRGCDIATRLVGSDYEEVRAGAFPEFVRWWRDLLLGPVRHMRWGGAA